MKALRILFALLFLSFLAGPAQAEGLVFSKEDRLLVIAPHPIDEALGAAGMMQSAVHAGAQVKVVYLTHGESNEMPLIFNQKKPFLTQSLFHKKRDQRTREALESASLLGLKKEDLFFFGYPDFQTMKIWQRYWESPKPFRSLYTRMNQVSSPEDFSYGRDYRGENILLDFEKVLKDFKPTQVLVTAPFDLNADHQAAYLYLQAALLNLRDSGLPMPKVYCYLVHLNEWPRPRRFEPDSTLAGPAHVEGLKSVEWKTHPLSAKEREAKKEMISRYDSQMTFNKKFLWAFVRANEIYCELVPEPISTAKVVDLPGEAPPSGDVRYYIVENELRIDVPLFYAFDERGSLVCEVFGYKKGKTFASMPKLSLRLFGKKLAVKDRRRNVYNVGILYKLEKKRLLLRIPLKALKDPEILFVCLRNVKEPLSVDFNAWKVLETSSPLLV
mgnify:FL=1